MSLLGFQYAEALFSLANETQKANEMAPLFEDISSQIEQDVRVYLSHPNVPKANKKTVVNKLTDNTLFRHFLFVLVDNNRLDALEDIKAEYKKILDHQNKHLDVVVYSKNALSDEEIDRLKKTLKQKKGRDITLKNVVDTTIVGGLKIEYEGYMLDETINNYLHSLKANLKK